MAQAIAQARREANDGLELISTALNSIMVKNDALEAKVSKLQARIDHLEGQCGHAAKDGVMQQTRSLTQATDFFHVTRVDGNSLKTHTINVSDIHIYGDLVWHGIPVGFSAPSLQPTLAPTPAPTASPSIEPTISGHHVKTITSPLDGSTLQVVCMNSPPFSAWDSTFAGPWTLYLYNGGGAPSADPS